MYDDHVNYKKLYLKTAQAVEEAINILMEVQQECEEVLIKAADQYAEDLCEAYRDSGEELELEDDMEAAFDEEDEEFDETDAD